MNINELHEAVMAGAKDAEEQLFKKLNEAFLFFLEQRVLDRADAEEVVQEALMLISNKYRDISFEKSFSAWAYNVLENILKHYYRSKKTRRIRKEQLMSNNDQDRVAYHNPELKRRLEHCLKKINESNNRYARILNLRYQGYSTEEIGGKLGVSSVNVLVILSRARSMLKHCLEEGNV